MVIHFSNSPPVWHGAADDYPEGNLGAQFGDLVVSTPNAEVMYAPLCDTPRSLILREGNHFGQDDAMVHPQLLEPKSSHLACMPTPSNLGENGILFLRLDRRQHWERTTSFNGLGQIKASVVARLASHGEHVLRQLDKLIADAQAGVYPTMARDLLPNKKTKRIQWYLKHYLRLLGTPASFEESALRWANAQRMQLETHGIVDFLSIYQPLLQDLPLLPRPVDNTRAGCITTNLMTANEMHAVGLPVWYVYKAKASTKSLFRRFMSDSDVQKLLQAKSIPPRPIQMGQVEDFGFISLRRPPDCVAIWTGSADDSARYLAIGEVLRGDRLATVPRPAAPTAAGSSTPVAPIVVQTSLPSAPQAASSSSTTASGKSILKTSIADDD